MIYRLAFVFLLCLPMLSTSQSYKISGKVLDGTTGEPVEFASQPEFLKIRSRLTEKMTPLRLRSASRKSPCVCAVSASAPSDDRGRRSIS